MDQPRWLGHALEHLGIKEIPGAMHNPRIQAFFKDAGHGEISRDETAWCAAFVGACLERAGYKSTRSLMARSYLGWGVDARAFDNPIGSIAILKRGTNPSLGHVGFLVGITADKVWLLGGNQSDSVSIAAYRRSRLIGLRWAGSKFQEQIVEDSDSKLFGFALNHVLKMEGGFTNDPVDPGGPTNKGITLGVFAAWRKVVLNSKTRARLISELKDIPDSTVRDIYYSKYWQAASCGAFPQALAIMHFDAAVNHGAGTAIRMLQQAVGVEIDGEVGPDTRRAAKVRPVKETIVTYAQIRRARYRSLRHFWRFGKGWLRRVDETLARSRLLLDHVVVGGGKSKSESVKNEPGKRSEGMLVARNQSGINGTKWWGQSVTIWGALVTAAATVVPVLAPMAGVEIGPDVVRQVGSETFSAVQAVVGLAGTMMTIFGRFRATQTLVQRSVQLKL